MAKSKSGTSKMAAKKARRAATAAAAKKASEAFEMRKVKPKFNVVGQKRIVGAVTQNKAVSRTRGLEKREETLGVEMEQKGKVNAFVDRRFGEDDAGLSKDDKLLMRYQREREGKVGSKAGRYNLGGGEYAFGGGDDGPRGGSDYYGDDDPFIRALGAEGAGEGEDVDDLNTLTHGGRALTSSLLNGDVELTLENVLAMKAAKERGDDIFGFESDDGAGSDDDVGTDKSFGGLTRAATSSYDKFEKRQAAIKAALEQREAAAAEAAAAGASRSKREIYAELIAKSKLHKHEAATLRALQEELTDRLDDEFDAQISNLLKPSIRKTLTRDERRAAKAAAIPSDYDVLLTDLSKDERIRASDLLKTPEELARLERERLQALEAARLARMRLPTGGVPSAGAPLGADSITDAPQFAFELDGGGSGDDGGVEMVLEQSAADLASMKPAERRALARKERKAVRKEKARVRMGEDAYAAKMAELHASHTARIKAKIGRPGPSSGSGTVHAPLADPADASMPYVFTLPPDAAALAKLLAPYSAADQAIALDRLVKCYPKELGDESVAALQQLFSLVLVHFSAVADDRATTPDGMAELDTLTAFAATLAHDVPHHAAAAAAAAVANIHDNLAAKPNEPLGTGTLLLIKLLAHIFPVSDARHPIVTPLTLLLGSVLTTVPVASLTAAASGIVVVALAHTFLAPSSRFMPEPLAFLLGLLAAIARAPPPLAAPPATAPAAALFSASTSSALPAASPLPLDLAFANELAPTPAETAAVAAAGLDALASFATLYTGYEAYAELFAPYADVLARLRANAPGLEAKIDAIVSHIDIVSAGMTKRRRPLTLLARKAASIAMYTPVFEEEYDPGKKYDPDRDRAELRRMKKEVKAARKGAMRELRKDNAFIEAAMVRKRKREDEVYAAKMKKIYGILEQDRAQGNVVDKLENREKKRKKRLK